MCGGGDGGFSHGIVCIEVKGPLCKVSSPSNVDFQG